MNHSDEAYAPCPPRKFPDSLLESRHRFRRQAPLRLLVIREAESQEFPFPWSSHRTLLAVHSQLELRREELRQAAHRAFAACAATTPSADFCHRITNDLSPLSLEFETGSRSPEVSSTAFDPQPLDLPSVPLMDWGFAAHCQLARTLPASYPALVHRLASLLHASFRPHLTARPLRFAITSPPSGCEEDLHLQAVDHARHTKKRARITRAQARRQLYAEGESQSQKPRSLKPDLLLPAVTSGLH